MPRPTRLKTQGFRNGLGCFNQALNPAVLQTLGWRRNRQACYQPTRVIVNACGDTTHTEL
jgi:hypothetical protein